MNQNEENPGACAAQSKAAIPSTPRQLRTITLVEQIGPDGNIAWTMIEGSATAFGLDEPNLVHALTRQLYGAQTHLTRSVAGISFDAFQHGFGSGRYAGAQEERGRAARARVEREEEAVRQQEDIRTAKKVAVKKRTANKPTAKRRAR